MNSLSPLTSWRQFRHLSSPPPPPPPPVGQSLGILLYQRCQHLAQPLGSLQHIYRGNRFILNLGASHWMRMRLILTWQSAHPLHTCGIQSLPWFLLSLTRTDQNLKRELVFSFALKYNLMGVSRYASINYGCLWGAQGRDMNDMWWKQPWSPLCFTQSRSRGSGISGVILLECAIPALLLPVSNIRIICSNCFKPQKPIISQYYIFKLCIEVFNMWMNGNSGIHFSILIQLILTGTICLLKKGTWYKLLS